MEALEVNFQKHLKEYSEAVVVYRKAKMEELNSWINKLDNNEEIPDHSILTQPVSYEKEYNRVIQMVTMSVDGEIDLTAREFSQYVLDEWDWQDSFKAVTSFYNKSL